MSEDAQIPVLSPPIIPEPISESDRHACQRFGCQKPIPAKRDHGAFCSGFCRQWANRHPEDDLRKKLPTIVLRNAQNGPGSSRLKPSALAVLERLQKGPGTNRELLDIAGFRYGARIAECRAVGHRIRCEAPGPTPGVRLYTLDVP